MTKLRRFLNHVTVGTGLPSATQRKEGFEPCRTETIGSGCVIITGGAKEDEKHHE